MTKPETVLTEAFIEELRRIGKQLSAVDVNEVSEAAEFLAKLAEKAEPVARVDGDGFIYETGLPLSPGTELYTHHPTDTELLKAAESALFTLERVSLLEGFLGTPSGNSVRLISDQLRASIEAHKGKA